MGCGPQTWWQSKNEAFRGTHLRAQEEDDLDVGWRGEAWETEPGSDSHPPSCRHTCSPRVGSLVR